ncbi:MAG: hypothetical protein IPO91_19860 [Chloroflexi bacterium]|nr:hypothetical protein [Chloroflexota bacterium]
MTAINQDQQKQQHHPLAHPCTDAEGQPVACEPIASERNHYFTGKLLTARDLRDESNYFLSHSRAHNRLLHGWGVLCGLIAARRPNTNCLDIESGVALDCCGRELIVPKTATIALPDNDQTELGGRFFACLQYVETPVEYLPALYAEGRMPGHREPNRIREGVALVWRKFDELPNVWRVKENREGMPECADCPEPGEQCSCLDPSCACADAIPIALITYVSPTANHEQTAPSAPYWQVETEGRPLLRTPATLTQICGINWVHGGETKLSSLRVPRSDTERAENPTLSEYALQIRFNGKIKASTGDGDGINPYTFIVVVPQEPDRPVYDPGDAEARYQVQLQADECGAIYRFYISESTGQVNIFDKHMLISLRCDFVVDENGNAVDGNHLGGRRPTGDGVAGGQFTSWTRIINDIPRTHNQGRPAGWQGKANQEG